MAIDNETVIDMAVFLLDFTFAKYEKHHAMGIAYQRGAPHTLPIVKF